MIKHSTGALSKEAKRRQDKAYAQSKAKGETYDYLIMGTGMSALCVGSLLANSGKKVCMVEAHDVPGGMAHSFKMGDFTFCAQVHYIWGCAPGGRVFQFLKKIGLEKDITFELLGPEFYDRMVMPDGKAVGIPYGFDRLAENIEAAYPGQKAAVQRFTRILQKIREELRSLPDRKIKWWEVIFKAYKAPTLIKYLRKTLQDVFDECGLSRESQAVLIANAGDMMAPPKDLSILCFASLFSGYNTGAYYPTKHFSGFVSRLARFITGHKGCRIYYETSVSKIDVKDDKVISVTAADGKVFKADRYICNMDPQSTAKNMIGWEKFPARFRKPLSYEYGPSGMMIYLGLKGIDLRKFGFGKFNTWHLEQWEMNKMWDEQGKNDFSNPWLFMSTPTLHTKDASTAPKGGQILEIASYMEFSPFSEVQSKSYRDYNALKLRIAERLIDIVEKKYVPGLRKHIVVKTIGSPTTHADFCRAPFGNAYGSNLTPKNIGLGRLKSETPFKNLWWCNASSGFAGIHGTISTGTQLYMDLTGDYFLKWSEVPSDDEFVERIRANTGK